MVEVALETCIQ